MGKRPLNTFYEIFERQNIGYLYKEDILDLYVIGKLKPDHYKVPGNISSQFITGLLFALPLLDGDSIIEITSPLESKGYIDLTLQMLNQYGIKIVTCAPPVFSELLKTSCPPCCWTMDFVINSPIPKCRLELRL